MTRVPLFIILLYTTFLSQADAQSPGTPITGWRMEENNGHYTFAPATLFGAPNLHYDVYPPDKDGSDDIAGWLLSKADKDVKAGGYTIIPGQSKAQDVKSFRIYSVAVKDAAGKSWLLNYMAYTRPDHSIRYGRIVEIPNTAVTRDNMNMAVQHFIKLSKQEGGLKDVAANGGGAGGSGNSGNTPATSGSGGTKSSPSKNAETPTTAPGQGIKPGELKGVVLHTEYGMGVGGMVIVKYMPYLILNDGTIYSHPYVCAYDLDVARSRQVEPNKWGTYTLNGKYMQVTMNGEKTNDWKDHWFWASPAKKGEKITGTWSTISGGGNTAFGGGSIVVATNELTFNGQGQFTTLSTGGGSYNGPTGSVTAYSNKDGAGVYTLDGFLLELKFNNGKVVRKNFASYDETKEVWVFGTSPYTPDDATGKKFKKK